MVADTKGLIDDYRKLMERENATLRAENAKMRAALTNLLHVVDHSPGALATVDAVLDARAALLPPEDSTDGK